MYHRIRAHRPDEKISRKEEGIPILILLRLSGLVVWVGLITCVIHPPWMEWSTFPAPSWLRWTGAGLGVVCVPLLFWVFTSLGKNVTDTVVTRKEATLVPWSLSLGPAPSLFGSRCVFDRLCFAFSQLVYPADGDSGTDPAGDTNTY